MLLEMISRRRILRCRVGGDKSRNIALEMVRKEWALEPQGEKWALGRSVGCSSLLTGGKSEKCGQT